MKYLFSISLIFVFSLLQAQQLFILELKDKGENVAERLNNPEEFLSRNAILRKKALQITLCERDLPLNAAYKKIIDEFASARQDLNIVGYSKWFNSIYIRSNNSDWIEEAIQWNFVKSIEPYALQTRVQFALTLPVQYGASDMQSQQVRGDYLHNMNFLGQGMFIAVFDGGFHNTQNVSHFQHLYTDGQLIGTFSFINNDTNVYFPGSHGTHVLSVMASKSPNQLVGSAPLANYWLMGTENEVNETKQEEINWLMGAEMADSLGVDIINSSLGYNTFDNPADNYTLQQLDGQTAIVTQAALMAARKGILVVNSAGNEGTSSWQKLLFPADADSILAVAAVNFEGNRASFSSLGPTTDNRIKPDVAARGVTVASSSTAGFIGPQNGTSFSAPIISGFAACLWQSNPNMNAQEIREAIIKSSHQFHNPDTLLGFGIVNFQKAFDDFVSVKAFDQKDEIAIYPNPTQDFIRIKLSHQSLISPARISIFNSSGVEVLTQDWIAGNTNEISLQGFPAGMYYLSILSKQIDRTFRVVKY